MRELNKLCAYFHKTGLVHCPKCNLKINKDYVERIKEKVALVPNEIKQRILDGLHSGLNVGQAIEAVGIDSDIGFQIIADNIETFKYSTLRKTIS